MPTLQDVETGEYHVLALPKRRRHHQDFTMLFRAVFADALARRGKSLSTLDWRVFMHLLCIAEFENAIDEYVSHIADVLDADRGAVSRSLQRLEELDFIARP